MFIDTHIHLDGEEFTEDLDLVVARAKEAGAEKLFVPGINLSSVKSVAELCEKYSGFCYPMIGLHPEDVKEDWESVLREMETHMQDAPWIAIGEVGLDFYWSREFEKEQIEVFDKQVQWAIKYNLPLMVHCRTAQNELLAVLRKYADNPKLRGVFHCFTGNEQEARRYLEYENWMLGIGGVLTFKKSKLPETLRNAVPLSRIVLETDAPYMAPVPHRGKRNESSFIPYIINTLAEVYSTSPDNIAETTTRNAKNLFNL
jgi:TatD DNase family protein